MLRQFASCTALLTGLAAGFAPPVAASELVTEIVEELRAEAIADAGPDAPMFLARALVSVDPDEWGLVPEEEHALALATATAWLAAGDVDAAGQAFAQLPTVDLWDPIWAADAALVASSLIDADLLPEATVVAVEGGVWPQAVQVAVSSAATRRYLRQQNYEMAAAAALQGIEALAAAEARWRTPLYALWLLTQEKQGRDAGALQRDLAAFDDPATDQLADNLLGASILGQPFPDLPLRNLVTDQATTVAEVLAPGPTLVVVGATWHEPSLLFTEALAAALPESWSLVLLALDVPDLPSDYQRAGAVATVVGDQRGWDSEFDNALQIGALPGWVLVDETATIRATAQVGEENAAVAVANVLAALTAWEQRQADNADEAEAPQAADQG